MTQPNTKPGSTQTVSECLCLAQFSRPVGLTAYARVLGPTAVAALLFVVALPAAASDGERLVRAAGFTPTATGTLTAYRTTANFAPTPIANTIVDERCINDADGAGYYIALRVDDVPGQDFRFVGNCAWKYGEKFWTFLRTAGEAMTAAEGNLPPASNFAPTEPKLDVNP